MKPYWKSFGHILAFVLMCLSHIGLGIVFSVIIADGVSQGTGWQPSQSQTYFFMVLLLVAIGLTIVFLIDLISFRVQLKKNPHPTKKEAEIRRSASPTLSSAPKTKVLPSKNDESPVYEISADGKKVPSYFFILKMFFFSAMAYFIITGVLAIAVIGALIYYLIVGRETYLIVMISIALALALVALAYLLITPKRVQNQISAAPASGLRIYEDRFETFRKLDNGREERASYLYADIHRHSQNEEHLGFVCKPNGKAVLLFITKRPELTPEMTEFLLSHID